MMEPGKMPSLNQNLWSLVIAFLGIGAAELYRLQTLYWFSVALGVITLGSMLVTTIAYTVNYWKKKS